jgi:hypothetical protein
MSVIVILNFLPAIKDSANLVTIMFGEIIVVEIICGGVLNMP